MSVYSNIRGMDMRYDFLEYLKDRERGRFGEGEPEWELYWLERAIDAGEMEKWEYQRLWRRRKVLQRRLEGRDVRWKEGIQACGGIPEHKRRGWEERGKLREIWEVLGD